RQAFYFAIFKEENTVLTFFIGLWIGGIVGVFVMCLVQVNRWDEERSKEDQDEPKNDQGDKPV
ncbi:MAG: DUF3789 domain-containing protein, partial [Faecousia sp.]